MFKTLRKFMKFSGAKNEKMFKLSMLISFFYAMAMALRIPAIMCIIMGLLRGEEITKYILGSIGIMALSLVVSMICRMLSTMLQTKAGYLCAAEKRIDIAQHLRYLPMGYFNANSLGTIASVATNTMENLGDVATRVVLIVSGGIIETTAIVIMIAIFDYRIALVSLVGIGLFFIANSFMQKAGTKISEEKIAADENLVSIVVEYLQGISEVKSYNLYGKASKKLEAANVGVGNVNTAMEVKYVPYQVLQSAILKLTGVAIVATSVLFWIQGSMPLLNAIGMTICAFMLYTSLEAMGAFSALLRVVDMCVGKAQDILDLDTMDIDGNEIVPESHDIEVKNIEFAYENRKIIDGVSLKIPEKTVTAIVGASGGGKTTLCNLIARFWDVDNGEITLGGRDVKEYSMNSLMSNFSFVFQNVYLFSDTVENNIKFGRPEASREEVVAAAKKACCHDFIMELPEGYNTVIGEGGASLSGGEKQRLSIARAIMKDAPVIILDEATANVDPENERELMAAIAELTNNKTIIMIAHRLKTVRNADQIIVMSEGRIAEQGTHAELMKLDGIYRTFVNSRKKAIGWKLSS